MKDLKLTMTPCLRAWVETKTFLERPMVTPISEKTIPASLNMGQAVLRRISEAELILYWIFLKKLKIIGIIQSRLNLFFKSYLMHFERVNQSVEFLNY